MPRIGVVLPSSASVADWTTALRRALPAQVWGALLATDPGGLPACADDELARSTDDLVAVPGAQPLEEGTRLLAAGLLGALIRVGESPGACLWQRGALRGVDPGARSAGPAELVAAALRARDALRRLGREAPGFGLLASDPRDAESVRQLRAAGVDCSGPLEAYAAAEVRVDAWLCATAPTLHAALAFAASGPRWALSLERDAEVWVPERGALQAALSGVLPLLPPPLELPRVQVQAKGARVFDDRCPYCHQSASSDATDGLAGPPVACAKCGATHHRDCLAEHGRGCAVHGCDSRLGTRWGVELPLDGLSPEQAQRVAFEVLPGGGTDGPLWVRVESPVDDPRRTPTTRRVRLVLPERAERGTWVHGFVAVETPRPFTVPGGALSLESTLRTRSERRQEQRTIVAQRAAIFGSGAGSALSRLGASIFGGRGGVTIPPGIRRYPIALRIPTAHPKSLDNRFGDTEESVQTKFRVQVGAEHAERVVEVV